MISSTVNGNRAVELPQRAFAAYGPNSYQFDYGNRLRDVTGKEAYRYDAQGRRVLAWSPIGNILSMYGQSGQLLYEENQRGSTTVSTHNIYLSSSRIAQNSYIYLSSSRIAQNSYSAAVATIMYQHTDALASPVAVSNAAGQVIDSTSYEPYGAAIGNPDYQGVGYTGHVMDAAAGLTDMQQRSNPVQTTANVVGSAVNLSGDLKPLLDEKKK